MLWPKCLDILVVFSGTYEMEKQILKDKKKTLKKCSQKDKIMYTMVTV